MTPLWQLSATELARLVQSREVSAREVSETVLVRLNDVNPRLNAIVQHSPELVLQQADAIDRRLVLGEDVGPLAGVPITVKINIDQEGFATSNGTRLRENLIAKSNSPAVDNLLRAGAVLLGRSNAPAFALRWFTNNLIYGSTRNPRDPTLTPGGSSGGGAAAVACGIGSIAIGTDLAGSVRYPAYACGIHALRPSVGRIPAYNASSPERPIGPQFMSMIGPMARTVADLRLSLAAMSPFDHRDPWWVPAPLQGPPAARRAAVCLRPDGVSVAEEVIEAVLDAGRRLSDSGWEVVPVEATPSFREADQVVEELWFGDRFESQAEAVAQEGDPGAAAVIAGMRPRVQQYPADVLERALVRRTTISREWVRFFNQYPVLLLPVSLELPFPDGLDQQGGEGFRRVWNAQLPMRALSCVGLPALTVSTRLIGSVPMGIQVVAARYREDLCLLAGEAIEVGGTPASPIDPTDLAPRSES